MLAAFYSPCCPQFPLLKRNINIGLVHHDEQRIEIGDWVLIDVGFAMSKLDEEEAHAALRALEQIGAEYEQELEELSLRIE